MTVLRSALQRGPTIISYEQANHRNEATKAQIHTNHMMKTNISEEFADALHLCIPKLKHIQLNETFFLNQYNPGHKSTQQLGTPSITNSCVQRDTSLMKLVFMLNMIVWDIDKLFGHKAADVISIVH